VQALTMSDGGSEDHDAEAVAETTVYGEVEDVTAEEVSTDEATDDEEIVGPVTIVVENKVVVRVDVEDVNLDAAEADEVVVSNELLVDAEDNG